MELQAITNGLGHLLKGGQYVKETDALVCVKDLIKSLRREDETCNIRRYLGYAQVLQKDLIPLLVFYGPADAELFDAVLRCMVNLTQPAKIVFRNEVPKDKTTHNCYMETEYCLQVYKQAFTNPNLLNVLTEKLTSILELVWEDRTEEHNLMIERILMLLRNILHVPPTENDLLRTDNDASTQDQIIWLMHECDLDKLILYIGASPNEQRYCVHVLEIISLMFREQTPEQLASAGASRLTREKERDAIELARVCEMQKAEKAANRLKFSTRHSRFGGTFVMKGVKSISEKEQIYHRPLNEIKSFTHDKDKKPKKIAKNRRPVEDNGGTRRSTLSIRVCLKEFCVDFIKQCYNPLMRSVKDALNHDAAQENDETYYLWSVRFFMQFQRLYHFDVELIRETMSIPEFHYVHTNMLNHQDMMSINKKDAIIWGKRLHLSLKTYAELLETLQAMMNSDSKRVRESAKVIEQNVFYMLEYRDILTLLLKKFDNTKQSKLFLKDLVETTHLYVKMMEKWCKSQGKIVVQKPKRARGKKKRKSKTTNETVKQDISRERLEELWDDLSGDLSEVLQDLTVTDEVISPFDAASDVPVDEQRVECVRRIHAALRNGHPNEAVGLLRAAREVWPERGEFGTADMSSEDEFMVLREVFFTHIPQKDDQPSQEEIMPEEEAEVYGEEIEHEEMAPTITHETEFNFRDFIISFAAYRIVQAYSLLLTNYKKNTVHTNHCLVKMLHRLSVDLGLPALLYQLSLFKTFKQIFDDTSTAALQFNEMKTFAKFVLRQFFKAADKNPKVFVEVLFWKNIKECYEIQDGYGSCKSTSTKGKVLWSEEEENELRQLFDEYKDDEGDVVDKILANLICQTRTRRQVVRQLIMMDLVTNSKQLKKGIGRKEVRWEQDEVDRLKQLFEEYKNAPDCVGSIVDRMEGKSKREITNKIVQLGWVEDKKELHKGKKNRGKKVDHVDGTGGNYPSKEFVSSDSDSSEDEKSSATESPWAHLERGDPLALITELRQMGNMDESIKWIKESLERAARDLEDEDEEDGPVATPLVPLMDEYETALENRIFQKFIYTLGINPPVDEQERFWRISLELDPEKLRQISLAIEPNSTETFPQLVFKYNISKSKGLVISKQLRDSTRVNRKACHRVSRIRDDMDSSTNESSKNDMDSSDDNELTIDERQSRPPKRKRARLAIMPSMSDTSDDNSDNMDTTEAGNKENGALDIVINSEASNNSITSNNLDKSDDEVVAGSNGESLKIMDSFPATALTQTLSDSEDDDHVTIARAVQHKKKTCIISDGESD